MTSSERTAAAAAASWVAAEQPGVGQLGQAAKDYAKARGQDAVKKVGDKLTGVTGSLTDKAENGGFKATAVTSAVQRVAQGDNPVKASLAGVGEGIKEKVKGAFGKSGGARRQQEVREHHRGHLASVSRWTSPTTSGPSSRSSRAS